MLEIKRLCVAVGHKTILSDLSMTLEPNALTVLIGKNGCGKSTLVSCIGGMRRHTGALLSDSQDLHSLSPRKRAQRIAILPQILQSPHMTVEELVRLGRTPHLTLGQRFGDKDTAAVESAIHATVLDSLRTQYLDILSGGERQKAYLAMILAQNAPLLVLDEPTTYMDVSVAHHFMALLRTLMEQQKKTVLAVMHDLNCALRFADRVAVMDAGHIAFHGTTAEVLATDIIERTFSVTRHEVDGRCFFEG
ncbi:MAG: ABC transporter ATP-binding protein [Clostridia bacterium]|nr:ABC transporter ATP-binding protein [Clostridia bacterium]